MILSQHQHTASIMKYNFENISTNTIYLNNCLHSSDLLENIRSKTIETNSLFTTVYDAYIMEDINKMYQPRTIRKKINA